MREALQDMVPDFGTRALSGEASADLASVRRNAAAFIDNLPVTNIRNSIDRRRWISTWMRTADGYRALGDLQLRRALLDEALEARLCALTAFEVARQLADPNDANWRELNAKIALCVDKFGRHRARSAEQVGIACCDHVQLPAFFLAADSAEARAPAVICISEDDEPLDACLGRLLPAATGRGLSLLVVAEADLVRHVQFKPDILLGCCLEHLAARADVDAGRIAVYGDGFAAVHATRFAASDRRVAAAVCDGGLWDSMRTHASVGWMTDLATRTEDVDARASRMRLARRMQGPVLVIAGVGGVVSAPEATRLHADCKSAGIDMDVVIPRTVQTPFGAIENFVAIGDFVFGWLERKLRARRPLTTIRYL